ncbi:RNA polymerase sigma factor [Salibacter halophilus]|uniref:RNA polymerase sigma factor n=1 Tax=Salibacter halophilus TaxID=1803916 RepID=UPI001CB9BB46|nr:sigma-70 family RNA polymerase sigma factor [Salibacter halophilus]
MSREELNSIEKRIAQFLAEGNEHAIELLYDHYADALYGVVLRIVRDDDLASDIIQEAFVKIWKNGKRYSKEKGKLFTWCLNITRNRAIDELRSKQRKGEIQNLDSSVNFIDRQHSTNPNIDHVGLREIVDSLDQEKRELIEMAYFGGYTQAEISKKMELPLGTVKTRMRNALKDLKNIFSVG